MKLKKNMLKNRLDVDGSDIALIHLYGSDSHSMSKTRKSIVTQLAGANAEVELRVEQLSGNMIVKNPHLLSERFKSFSFFSGPQILIILDAADNLTSALKKLMPEWNIGDSQIIMVSNTLSSRSSLRQFSEHGKNFLSIPFYNEAMNRADIESLMTDANLSFSTNNVLETVVNLGMGYSYQAFSELIEKMSLYKLNDSSPLTFEELERLSFNSDETNDNELIQNLTNGNTSEMTLMINKLYNQGVSPIQMTMKANKHFLLLHRISIEPNNFENIIKTVFPPIFGSRKRDLIQQCKNWNQDKLEIAIKILSEVDIKTRLSPKIPTIELVERAFIKICYLYKRN